MKWIYLLLIFFFLSCSHHYNIGKNQASLYPVKDSVFHADTNILVMIKPYKEHLDSSMNQVIGFSEQHLSKGIPESLLGNFICDAMLNHILNTYSISADFCVMNNGGFRAAIPRGVITLRNIYELMPFENELVTLELKGETVKKLLDKIAAKGGEPVSGVTFIIKDKKAEEIYVGAQPFNPERTYNLLTTDYLANGGEDLFFLKEALKKQVHHYKFRDAIVDYVRGISALNININSKLDGRIRKN